MKNDNSNHKSITGQPLPLTTTFAQLRLRALQTPITKPDFTVADVSIERHAKIFDFNSNYVLAVILVCFPKNQKFYWFCEVCFVSKASQKNVALNLLTKKQKALFEQVKNQALNGVEVKHNFKQLLKDSIIWEVEFNESDYEHLNPIYLDLLKEKGEK